MLPMKMKNARRADDGQETLAHAVADHVLDEVVETRDEQLEHRLQLARRLHRQLAADRDQNQPR